MLCSGLTPALAQTQPANAEYDVVLLQGRVLDPESGLDAVRNIGINGGRIAIVTEAPLRGRKQIDASAMVVGPGFIDLHSHAINVPSNWMQAFDGVTTALELEAGSLPIARAY
jgi:N-acyl-D-glutamate deacylase